MPFVAEYEPLRHFLNSKCSKEYINMEKNLNIVLQPQKICFAKNCIKITDSRTGSYEIPYRELVLAGIRIRDEETGGFYEPEITEITEEMEGELLLWDSGNCRFIIGTEQTGRAAGSMLSELSLHAPYILIGNQDWFDSNDKEAFGEVDGMVKLMRGFW